MTKEWKPADVFDVLGSEVARQILTLASRGPMSAADLADRCGVSEPTIYRRIHALQEYDMLAEEVTYDDEGHHYHTYRTTLEAVSVRVDAGQLAVDIQVGEDYSDKFLEFWQDLEDGARHPSSDPRPDRSTDSSSDLSRG